MLANEGPPVDVEESLNLADVFRNLSAGSERQRTVAFNGGQVELSRQDSPGKHCEYVRIKKATPEKAEGKVLIARGLIELTLICHEAKKRFAPRQDAYWKENGICSSLVSSGYAVADVELEGLDRRENGFRINDYAETIDHSLRAENPDYIVTQSTGGMGFLKCMADRFFVTDQNGKPVRDAGGKLVLREKIDTTGLPKIAFISDCLLGGYSRGSQWMMEKTGEITRDNGGYTSKPPGTAELVAGSSWLIDLQEMLQAVENHHLCPKLVFIAANVGDDFAVGPIAFERVDELNERKLVSWLTRTLSGRRFGDLAKERGFEHGGMVDRNGALGFPLTHVLRIEVVGSTHIDVLQGKVIEMINQVIGIYDDFEQIPQNVLDEIFSQLLEGKIETAESGGRELRHLKISVEPMDVEKSKKYMIAALVLLECLDRFDKKGLVARLIHHLEQLLTVKRESELTNDTIKLPSAEQSAVTAKENPITKAWQAMQEANLVKKYRQASGELAALIKAVRSGESLPEYDPKYQPIVDYLTVCRQYIRSTVGPNEKRSAVVSSPEIEPGADCQVIVSTAIDPTPGEIRDLGLILAPVSIEIVYRNGDSRTITDGSCGKEFISILQDPSVSSITTAATPNGLISAYESVPPNKTRLLFFTIAPSLSTQAGVAEIALESANTKTEEKPQLAVEASFLSRAGMVLVKEAINLAKQGRSAEEITIALEALKSRMVVVGVVSDIKGVIKGGRLSKDVQGSLRKVMDAATGPVARAAGAVQKLFKPQVMIQIEHDGKQRFLGIRFKDKSAVLKDLVENLPERIDFKHEINIAYCGNESKAQELKQLLQVKYNLSDDQAEEYVKIVPVSKALAVHLRPGFIGICVVRAQTA